jgi:hypothetical protein
MVVEEVENVHEACFALEEKSNNVSTKGEIIEMRGSETFVQENDDSPDEAKQCEKFQIYREEIFILVPTQQVLKF